MTSPVANPAPGAAAGSGRVWFITGTSTGFGRALAESAVSHGDCVVATARDVATLGDLAERAPRRVRTVRLDVTDPDSVHDAVATATTEFGRIDVLVNNAGYALRGAVEELAEDELRRQFETNVFGAMAVTRAVLPTMRSGGSGHVVQMSSVGGVVSTLGGTAYAGTKFALEGLSEGLADEVRHLGIRVTIVQPGPFRTDFVGRSARWAEPMEDYASVLGPARERFEAMDGTQPGDPARAAEAIRRVVETDDPPLRLPLGGPAIDRIRSRLTQRLEELDIVESLGRDTDFVDG